ncbi:uncharacterized protein BDV17DRAFT_273911 [Aspergillus undulatus]|uniref:uncharacterized protein n=1 Tax=Aspergillus undulatus TaxID=1810928 RepID=UPI003CCDF39F
MYSGKSVEAPAYAVLVTALLSRLVSGLSKVARGRHRACPGQQSRNDVAFLHAESKIILDSGFFLCQLRGPH